MHWHCITVQMSCHLSNSIELCAMVNFAVGKPLLTIPDSKVHWANMGPTWTLPAPDGPHVGPMNLAFRDIILQWSHKTIDHIVLLNVDHRQNKRYIYGNLMRLPDWWHGTVVCTVLLLIFLLVISTAAYSPSDVKPTYGIIFQHSMITLWHVGVFCITSPF